MAETTHFRIHYIKNNETLIPKVSRWLEHAHARVTGDLRVTIPGKSDFFLYPSHNDFEQSNIAPGDEGTGGVTEAFKFRFIVPVTGSDRFLEKVITHEFTHVVEFHVLYGGFWRTVRLFKSVFYPLWLMEGLSEYEAGDEDPASEEMILRDATLSDRLIPLDHLHNFGHLQSHQITQAYKQGEHALRFLADEYGEDAVREFLFDYREKFDVNAVLQSVIGRDVFQFDARWREHLHERYGPQAAGREEPSAYGRRLTQGQEFNTNPAWSPDGRTIAFISDREAYGTNRMYLMMPDGTRVRPLLNRQMYDDLDYLHRGRVSFNPDGRRLLFAGEKNQQDELYILDISSGELARVRLPEKFAAIQDPAWHTDGRRLVFAALKDGRRDLYLFDLASRRLTRLTRDEWAEQDPVISPDGTWVAYAAERDGQLDLLVMPVDGSSDTPVSVTATAWNEKHPAWSPDGAFLYYTADQSGIYNLYRIPVIPTGGSGDPPQQSGPPVPLANVKTGMFSPAPSPDGARLAFVGYREGEMNVYVGTVPAPGAAPAPLPGWDERRHKLASAMVAAATTAVATAPASPLTAAGTTQLEIAHKGPYRAWPFVLTPLSSTDLFFPALFYSSQSGLFVISYWQMSDFLGNHNLNTAVIYQSQDRVLNYDVGYQYRRFRPWLFVRAAREDNVFFRLIREGNTLRVLHAGLESTQLESGGIQYPFDRYRRFELGYSQLRDEYTIVTSSNLRLTERQKQVTVGLVRDTADGKTLDILEGSRTNLTVGVGQHEGRILWESTSPVLGPAFPYQTYSLNHEAYWTPSEPHTFATRFVGIAWEGHRERGERKPIRLPIRGYPQAEDPEGYRGAILTVEYRVPIARNINYHLWYFIPSLYIKNLQLVGFGDAGFAWDTWDGFTGQRLKDWRAGAGSGLRLQTFIFQSFPLVLSLEFAKPLDGRDRWDVLFRLGPTF